MRTSRACRRAGVRQNMSAVGSSADNATAESFNAPFQRETLKARKGRSSEREAHLDAFRRLSRYNTRRRHSRLGPAIPDRLREHLPLNINYPDPSRIDVFKIRGQGPCPVEGQWTHNRVEGSSPTPRC
ncbi:integrase core domain-containing protein [Streptomyces sp. NPDC001834]|uniref:integrase core domain-containing protein n=1 Tax=Streptomyces sp. NPDC001834 TaxID=3364616 RepID=UPI00368823A2